MKYEKPRLVAEVLAVDSIQQRLGYVPSKVCQNFLDLYTLCVTSELTTLAAYEADE